MTVAFDTETALIAQGLHAPPLACVSYQYVGDPPGLDYWEDAAWGLKRILSNDQIVGHNVAYDMAVAVAQFPELLDDVIRAYDEDRVFDTMIRQKLLDIAAGCYRGRFGEGGKWLKYDYSLFAVTKRLTGRILEKDEWRLKYGELRETPFDAWPDGAKQYPKEDARATLDCFLAQERHKDYLKSQHLEVRAALHLHLISCWGLHTDTQKIVDLERETFAARDEVKGRLVAAGLVREKGSRDTKAAQAYMQNVCNGKGLTIRRTPADGVCLDADACEYADDDLLRDYAAYTSLGTVVSKDVPAFRSPPIHTHFDLAGSGRTTSSNPNVQNIRRLPGIREIFVPRPGKVFIDADYNALELWSLAQACLYLLGKSHLSEVLNAGNDPHTALAADILKISYDTAAERHKNKKDDEFSNARQTAKVANFGFPGGLGPAKLVLFARKTYGVTLTEQEATKLREAWFSRWPEMVEYFRLVNRLQGPDGLVTVTIPGTGMIRGGIYFTEACNTFFQSLGAAAAKAAGWLLTKACYQDEASPLYGSRPVNMVHDQWLIETDDAPGAHDAAIETARLMREGARKYLPQCVPGVEPLLCRYWSKKAQPVFVDGRLVPWS